MSSRPISVLCAVVCVCGTLLAGTPAGLWLDVPFVPQEKDGCGAASAAMVIGYWLKQQPKPAQAPGAHEIQRALYSRKEHGVNASDLERYLQTQGFRTFAFHGAWEDLQHHLEKGRPLIAVLKPPNSGILDRGSVLHYVVIVGLEGARGSKEAAVLLNDPAQRKLLRQDWQAFERQWSASGNWLLLALPQQTNR